MDYIGRLYAGVLNTRKSLGPKIPTYEESGASLVEYALLVALISVVALGGISIVGQNTSDTMIIAACGTEENPIACCTDQGIENAGAVCGPFSFQQAGGLDGVGR